MMMYRGEQVFGAALNDESTTTTNAWSAKKVSDEIGILSNKVDDVTEKSKTEPVYQNSINISNIGNNEELAVRRPDDNSGTFLYEIYYSFKTPAMKWVTAACFTRVYSSYEDATAWGFNGEAVPIYYQDSDTGDIEFLGTLHLHVIIDGLINWYPKKGITGTGSISVNVLKIG